MYVIKHLGITEAKNPAAVKAQMKIRDVVSCHPSLNLVMGTIMKMTTMLQSWLNTFRWAYWMAAKLSKTYVSVCWSCRHDYVLQVTFSMYK